MSFNSDTVSLYQLSLSATIGPDVWQRTRPQPVLVTIHAHTNLVRAGNTDNVADSVHYGHLATTLRNLEHTSFSSLVDLAHAVADEGLKYSSVDSVHVLTTAPKQLLHASSLGVELVKSAAQSPRLTLHINDLSLETIIGVNPPERVHKQQIVTTLSFLDPQCLPMVDRLTEHIQSTSFLTLEAFATSLARVACFLDGMDAVTIKAQKPSAISFAHSSGVQLTRNRAFFQPEPSPS